MFIVHPLFQGVTFGLLPKFERLRLLHKYMFYLLYDYKGVYVEEASNKVDSENCIVSFSDTWQRLKVQITET